MDASGRTILSSVPVWGPSASVDGVLALWQRRPADEISLSPREHGVAIQLSPTRWRESTLNGEGRTGRYFAPVGAVNLIPAGSEHWAYWGEPKESAYFSLQPERLRDHARQEYARDQFELRATARATPDDTILRLAMILCDAFRSQTLLTPLYLDSLATLLIAHLLRFHSSLSEVRPDARRPRGGLAPSARSQVLAYMEAHCTRAVSVSELSSLAGLAPNHFLTAFRQSTGITPHQHLLRLRLNAAELLIRKRELPLAAIAQHCGFSSQSHMTRTFARIRNLRPSQYARQEGSKI